MRKNSEAASLWSRENILVCAARQKEILESAARACASGGRVLYSTCTWAVEENEEQVLSFLIRHPEFSLAEPAPAVSAVASCGITPKDSPVSLSRTLRFYPHRFPGEGQFLAIFEKTGEAEERRGPKKEKKKAKEKPSPYEKTVRDFLREVLSEEPREKILFRGEEAYLCPDTAIPPERFVSPGTLLGTVQKGRVIPHHRFFLAYADTFRRKVMLDPFDPRVEAYLAGEELALSGERGFAVLFAGRCPLGGVKISDGRGKNFYPKGLRKAKKDV